jgi:hypothetical protein
MAEAPAAQRLRPFTRFSGSVMGAVAVPVRVPPSPAAKPANISTNAVMNPASACRCSLPVYRG